VGNAPQQEQDHDAAVDVVAAEPDPRGMAQEHGDGQHGHGGLGAQRPGDDRDHDDARPEPGHAADGGGADGGQAQREPAERIGHPATIRALRA
jgi:hypothetical protein